MKNKSFHTVAVKGCFDSGVLTGIRRHLERCYPDEGCGFLLGSIEQEETGERFVIQDFRMAPNSETLQPERRYIINPSVYLEEEREARRKGMDLIGVFHSHPNHVPEPSETDLEWAQPHFLYLIVEVDEGVGNECKGWYLSERGDEYLPVPLAKISASPEAGEEEVPLN